MFFLPLRKLAGLEYLARGRSAPLTRVRRLLAASAVTPSPDLLSHRKWIVVRASRERGFWAGAGQTFRPSPPRRGSSGFRARSLSPSLRPRETRGFTEGDAPAFAALEPPASMGLEWMEWRESEWRGTRMMARA